MTGSVAKYVVPVLDVGLAVLAGAVWYVQPEAGALPLLFIGTAWLLRVAIHGYLTRATPFDLPLVLFLLTATAATIIAYNQEREWLQGPTPLMWAWAKFYYIVAALGLYYAIANLWEIKQVWWLIRLYALLGTGVAIYFLLTNDWGALTVKFSVLTQIGVWISTWRPYVPGHRLSPNVAGGIVAMILPYFVPLVQEARRQGQTRAVAVWSVAVIAALFSLVMSGSRGAWLGLIVVGASWYLMHQIGFWLQRDQGAERRSSIALALAAVSAAAVFAAVALLVKLGTSSDEFLTSQLPGVDTVISRLELLQGSWMLAQGYWLTGGGLGTFPMLFSAYYLLIPVYFIIHSHNLFLDMLIEQGILGLCSYVSLLAVFTLFSVRGIRYLAGIHSNLDEEPAVRLRWTIEASLASVAVAITHGLVDDIPYGSRALLLMFVPFAMVAALREYFPQRIWRVPSKSIPVGIGLVALVMLWQRESLLGAWFANWGTLAQNRVELSYHWSALPPESVRGYADLSSAVNNYNRALLYDPMQRTANQRLGAIALARGDYDAARNYLEATYACDSENPVTWQLLGDAYLGLGEMDAAYAMWSRVDDAPAKLEAEASVRYDRIGDYTRAGWVRALSESIVVGRGKGQ